MTKQIWANLAVRDVGRTRKFFTDLGLKLNVGYDSGDQLASILFGDDDFVVHFFPESTLKRAADTAIVDARNESEVLFTLSAETRTEVDEWAKKVKAAGGTMWAEPTESQGMYGCGFADPDGHRWNILCR